MYTTSIKPTFALKGVAPAGKLKHIQRGVLPAVELFATMLGEIDWGKSSCAVPALCGRLEILGVATMLPVVAQIGSSTLPQTRNTRAQRPRFHALNRRVSQNDENGTSQSTTWSGYAATGSGFTKAFGSWIVPTATCSSGDRYSSF